MSKVLTEKRFGQFLDPIPPSHEFLTLNFSLNPTPRINRWRNYGLSADFLGDYFAAFFPGDKLDSSPINRRDTVKASISYIANELLENAIKYSDTSIGLPASIALYLYEDSIIFEVTNPTQASTAEQYQQFIETLLQADLASLYIEQLEKNAMSGDSSNMGLLTILNDYETRLGWKFTDINSFVKVSVMAQVDV